MTRNHEYQYTLIIKLVDQTDLELLKPHIPPACCIELNKEKVYITFPSMFAKKRPRQKVCEVINLIRAMADEVRARFELFESKTDNYNITWSYRHMTAHVSSLSPDVIVLWKCVRRKKRAGAEV